MPWLKSTRYLDGKVWIDFSKAFNTADECINSFTRFEKDDSFGRPGCWPIFWPANDEELKSFEEFIKEANSQKSDPTEELAKNLLELVKSVTKHLKED